MVKKTTVRGLEEQTIKEYRVLAAERTANTGESVSMNSLYIEAIRGYLEHSANKRGMKRA